MLSLSFFSCKNENNEVEPEEVDLETTVEETELTVDEETEEAVQTIRVEIEPKNNSGISGTVIFTEENGEVSLEANLSGLSEGTHAMHIHEKGDCSAADATSAGGHWNPTFEDHGKWGDEAGFHRGDIGNFEANAEGNATVNFSTDLWCIGCEDEKRNIVGKAVIIHDGVDDYTSQPSGAAGQRIGCGVIEMEDVNAE